jgi:hypothetical protein
MIDFIDKTPEKAGTPINRKNLMALQGFENLDIIFNDDGSIVEINELGHTKTTIFNNDGSIMETFVGEKTITKITTFNDKTIAIEEVLT